MSWTGKKKCLEGAKTMLSQPPRSIIIAVPGGARAQARRSTGDVLGGTTSRKISGSLERSRAKAEDEGNGSHSELLSRMDGIG